MNSLYLSDKKLPYQFTPTIMKSNEIRKARIKNHNLSILQYIYNGHELKPLRCLLSNTTGWKNVPDRITGEDKIRFNIDFNHIRQEQLGKKGAGNSKDKNKKYQPSGIFREYKLDKPKNKMYLIEFMTIMPISQEHHDYISQDSALGNLSLHNYTIDEWPWFLETEQNFNDVCKRYKLEFKYDWFVDHLSEIHYPSIYNRMLEEF